MKPWWTRLAARIDALSLRERVILFLTLIVLSMLLIDTLWLAPSQVLHRQLTQRFAAQNGELTRLQEELKNSGAGTGPGQQVREELAQVHERLAAVNQEIAQLPTARAGATPLTQVLTHFLRRHEGLVLVRTATLSSDSLLGTLATVTGLSRQGVELTVSGPYHELTRYVQTLERALPALRWGGMKVISEGQTAELTLQVWLIGDAP